MTPKWGEWYGEFIKLVVRPRYAFVVWASALLLLLVPPPSQLQVQSVRNEYGPWIFVLFVISFVLWATDRLLALFQYWAAGRTLKQSVFGLTAREKYVLAKHLVSENDTLAWDNKLTEIRTLSHKKILKRLDINATNPRYTIEPEIWRCLLTYKVEFIASARAANPDKQLD